MLVAIFMAMKAPMFVDTTPAMTGLSSEARENEMPTTVVKQSIKPIATSKKLGTICTLIMIEAFSFLAETVISAQYLRTRCPFLIYSKKPLSH